jgi:hypothetical protein
MSSIPPLTSKAAPPPSSIRRIARVDDNEVWHMAKTLLQINGFAGAALFANQKANALLKANEIEGAAIWGRIERAISDMKRLGYLPSIS